MIHQYKSYGYNIVLDVNSGSVHIVDEIVYDIISMYEQHGKAEIVNQFSGKYPVAELEEALEEIEELKNQQQLFTDDAYRQYMKDFEKRETVVKAMCLHIAHDCNLACRYCFAEEGEYHGKKEFMSLDAGKQALDYLVSHSGSRVNLEVDFFGWEPLMNFEVVKRLVAYGRKLEKENNKKFRFTLTTNGVLLTDEVMDFCNKEIANVVLSLDGRREVNDRMRPFRKGKGSYDLIVPRYQTFVDKRGDMDYYVRGTFTRENLDFSEDVRHFADLGFKQMSIEPVVAVDKEQYAIKESDIPRIKQEYDKLAALYLERVKNNKPFNFFHFMLDLDQGP